jgi:excisionase family DNA binding protein
MSKQTPDVMTLNEVAEYLRIPRSTVYKLVREGRIPGQKIGRQWRFRRAVVENWLGPRHNHDEGRVR